MDDRDTDDLRRRAERLTIRDRHRLAGRVARLDDAGSPVDHDRLRRDIEAGEARLARRAAAVPQLTYPEQLPVTAHREELLAAIAANQVVVVAGETGSGKTTQIPKLCLELGRGVAGTIGHTQPRRIAARTVAARIAEELDVELGGAVGYAVRFNDRVGEDTLVKLMTDGILLAELPRDRLLTRYDTIIVDEAHERSLNIDFLLGYLAQLLPRRPDLKVVVTSATIDTARFSEHFGGAPVVEVSGRTFPVEIRWRPPGEDGEATDQTQSVVAAVEECCREGPGDVLVFLSGEREIRDTADGLRSALAADTDILPLYARLSAAEQHRVFRPHGGRRVVLATNVAETSITVPGIRYVVDPGTARISRYNTRTKVQSLPIEPISQASAAQRSGRCGRIGPGVCVRLYAEEDFDGRPEFTDPEILRTNLASVILQMASLGLGDVEAFPFVEPPDRRAVRAANELLVELGALDTERAGVRLTATGRSMARLPVDPRLARMLVEADREDVVREVTVVAAGLSIQDPREWPTEERQAATEAHRRFADADSDFVAMLNLWRHLQEGQRQLTSSAFRRRCRREFLNFQRVREWEDLCSQLRQAGRDLGIRPGPARRVEGEPAIDGAALHRALLAGLLSHVGKRADPPARPGARPERRRERPARIYEGARSTRYSIGSSSGLAGAPAWVMAAELVETNRLWARTAARIEPAWAEQVGAHLVVHHYDEPQWDRRRAGTVALERVTLYGLPLASGRRVDYARFDPALAHDLFVRHALVEGDWDTHHAFVDHNRRSAAEVVAIEDRVRRRDLLIDDDGLAALYAERVPARVTSGRNFDRWWRDERRSRPDLLDFGPAMLVDPGAGRVRFADYPDHWDVGGTRFALSYVYDPSAADDGVTVEVPLGALERVEAGTFDWQVPGHRAEVVAALLRSLPKEARRAFTPAMATAEAFVADCVPADGPLLGVLAGWLARRSGVPVSVGSWDLGTLPPHLRVTYAVVDGQGRVLASSRDLAALQDRLREPLRRAVAAAAAGVEHPPTQGWEFGSIPAAVEVSVAGAAVVAFPGLVQEAGQVAVRVALDEDGRDRAMAAATRHLLLVTTNPPVARAARDLPADAKLALAHVPHASLTAFLEDCAAAAVDQLVSAAGGPAWDGPGWERLHSAVAGGLAAATPRVVTRAALAVTWAHVVRQRVERMTAPSLRPSAADVARQLDRLIAPGFVTRTGAGRLIDLVRYLRGAERRLDRLVEDPGRDQARLRPVRAIEAELDHVAGTSGWTGVDDVDAVRWMLEELRVSIWAQPLGTSQPVSEARVRRALARIAG